MVFKILDYRMATATIEQFNNDASKMTPDMVKMMKKLREHYKTE
tara:strand:- start:1283 stop:1414 length:132 start_codon:yes stop_codon:yes gene_type:complete